MLLRYFTFVSKSVGFYGSWTNRIFRAGIRFAFNFSILDAIKNIFLPPLSGGVSPTLFALYKYEL